MRFLSIGAGLLYGAAYVAAVELDPNSDDSIKAATQQYAQGLMTFYKGDTPGLPKEEVGVFPKPPYYWWQAGAAWGSLIEYTQLTGDSSYVPTLHQALVANYGPENNLLLPWKKDQEGNDDQAFWALSLMSAIEYHFPDPADPPPATYLEVVENCFNNIVPRWDETSCNGGFKWQIYPENDYGYNYKNSISNGAVFALGARLARYTGNQMYADWAVKIWDWTKAIGLISDNYEVFDGADDRKNCEERDHTQWSYNIGMFLHGASVMYNITDGAEDWKQRTSGLLDHAGVFFTPYDDATDIMFEVACERGENGRGCNVDQLSFKAYLSRFLSKAAIMAPFVEERATKWLTASAVGAAKACSGEGNLCGYKWYTGESDGTTGVGQQMSALEVTQALLTLRNKVVPSTGADERPSSPSLSAASSLVPPETANAIIETPAGEENNGTPTGGVSSLTESPQASVSSGSTSSPSTSGFHSCASTSTATVYVTTSSSSSSSSSLASLASSASSVALPPKVVPTPASSVSSRGGLSPSGVPPSGVSPSGGSPSGLSPSGAAPTVPPGNNTGPITIFPGAAASTRVTAISLLVAAVCVVINGLL